jgi:hypothetical protein
LHLNWGYFLLFFFFLFDVTMTELDAEGLAPNLLRLKLYCI